MKMFSIVLPTCRFAQRAAIAAICAAICIPVAYSQIRDEAFQQAATTVPPYLLLQYATVVGTNNRISATWVPVVSSTGAITYEDITVLFNADASGNLTVAPGYPQAVPSPTPLVTGFGAGKYMAYGSYSNLMINVSGPGITAGGATE